MPRRRPRTDTALHLAEVAMLAPLVAGSRLARIVAEGATPSARGRRELWDMVAEKQLAFAQASWAMWLEAWRLQARLALWPLGAAPTAAQAAHMLHAGLGRIAAQGLAPVRRRVRANARRLR